MVGISRWTVMVKVLARICAKRVSSLATRGGSVTAKEVTADSGDDKLTMRPSRGRRVYAFVR